MGRKERLEGLADVLLLAAEKARDMARIAHAGCTFSREEALSKQLEGIAMEYRAIAHTLPSAPRAGKR